MVVETVTLVVLVDKSKRCTAKIKEYADSAFEKIKLDGCETFPWSVDLVDRIRINRQLDMNSIRFKIILISQSEIEEWQPFVCCEDIQFATWEIADIRQLVLSEHVIAKEGYLNGNRVQLSTHGFSNFNSSGSQNIFIYTFPELKLTQSNELDGDSLVKVLRDMAISQSNTQDDNHHSNPSNLDPSILSSMGENNSQIDEKESIYTEDKELDTHIMAQIN